MVASPIQLHIISNDHSVILLTLEIFLTSLIDVTLFFCFVLPLVFCKIHELVSDSRLLGSCISNVHWEVITLKLVFTLVGSLITFVVNEISVGTAL